MTFRVCLEDHSVSALVEATYIQNTGWQLLVTEPVKVRNSDLLEGYKYVGLPRRVFKGGILETAIADLLREMTNAA